MGQGVSGNLAAIKHYDVAVIGFGPTGAVLANLLAICGLQVLVIERECGIYPLPRAVHFDDETMRVFQTIGIADALRQKIRVNPGMRFVDGDGTLLLDWPRPQETTQHGWNASYRFHQPDLEVLLRQAVQSHPNITVKTEMELLHLGQKSDHVSLQCLAGDSGLTSRMTASYVVGCDGARSSVRQAMGVSMENLGFRQSWLVVDVLLYREMPELGDHSVQFCDAERPMTYCRSPKNRRRWEITMQAGESAGEMTDPDRVWQFLSRWITPDDAQIERSVVYTFESALAETWRKDRLLLAGDAAHLTPPFMGQGMCSGIRDAANLAWKLALTLKGRGASGLLDSYGQERSPHMRAYIETAIKLGYLINSIDGASGPAQAGDAADKSPKMASIAPGLGGAAAVCFGIAPGQHTGRLFGQPLLVGGRRMDDLCGYRPVLISRTPLPAAGGASEPVSALGPVYLDAQSEPALEAELSALQVNAVLVRPDRHILATAETDAEITALAGLKFPSPLD